LEGVFLTIFSAKCFFIFKKRVRLLRNFLKGQGARSQNDILTAASKDVQTPVTRAELGAMSKIILSECTDDPTNHSVHE